MTVANPNKSYKAVPSASPSSRLVCESQTFGNSYDGEKVTRPLGKSKPQKIEEKKV